MDGFPISAQSQLGGNFPSLTECPFVRPAAANVVQRERTDSPNAPLGCDDSARGGEDVCEGRTITGRANTLCQHEEGTVHTQGGAAQM